MEIHETLFGLRLDISESLGTRPIYAMLNPYGVLGVTVGWNGPYGHLISLTRESEHDPDPRKRDRQTTVVSLAVEVA